MSDEKPKRGQAEIEVPEILLMERDFEFVVHMPLQECMMHLENRVRASSWSSKKFAFKEVDTNSYTFGLEVRGKIGYWVTGTLHAQTENATLVIGKAGLDPAVLLLFLGSIVGVIFFGFYETHQSNISTGLGFACLMFGIFSLIYFMAKIYRNSLIRWIRSLDGGDDAPFFDW